MQTLQEQAVRVDKTESIPTISYTSDAPVRDPKDDRFDRGPFARRIAETLVRRKDPASMVIAIYGAWGDGKTTVLNFIRDYLQKEEAVVRVNFNPWRLDGEDALLSGFFSTLADALDAELKTRTEKIGVLLKKYSFLLKPVPVVKELEGIASAAGAIMSSESLDKLRTQIISILRESKKRVIVTIDDIDRLEKAEIQAIFQLWHRLRIQRHSGSCARLYLIARGCRQMTDYCCELIIYVHELEIYVHGCGGRGCWQPRQSERAIQAKGVSDADELARAARPATDRILQPPTMTKGP